jgi:hypothetical protein
MVVPLGAPPMGDEPFLQEMPAPESVQKTYWKWWWLICVLYILMVMARWYAGDVWGGIVSLVMALWAYMLVRDNLKNMTQMCLFFFGVVTLFQFAMDLISLLTCIHGRVFEQQTASPVHTTGSTETVNYAVTITYYPFFCRKQTFLYNFQSGLMIACVVMDLVGIALATSTYNAFPTSMFEEPDLRRNIGPGGFDDYGSQRGGGRGGGGNPGGRPQNPGSTFRVFEGAGNRLG